MNRKQIIHWCHGQHAAAYYMDKTASTRKRSLFELPVNIEHADRLQNRIKTLTNQKLLHFRMILVYGDRQEFVHTPLIPRIKVEGSRKLFLFSTTEPVKIGPDLRSCVLVDDLGYSLRINPNFDPKPRVQDIQIMVQT